MIFKKSDINLLTSYRLMEKKTYSQLNLLKFLIIEALIFIIVSLFMFLRIIYLKVEIASFNKKIEKYKPIYQTLDEYNRIKRIYESKKKFYERVHMDNVKLYQALTTLERQIPKDVNIESFELKDNKLNLLVKANSELSILQFVYNMQKEDIFKNVIITGISDNNGKLAAIKCDLVVK